MVSRRAFLIGSGAVALGSALPAGAANALPPVPEPHPSWLSDAVLYQIYPQSFADTDADELLVVETMRERKGLMDAHASAFLALPGGIGTCEELFEVWTSRYIGMHGKPVVLLDPEGHYKGLLDWVRGLVSDGFASQRALDALTVVTDVDAALEACAG